MGYEKKGLPEIPVKTGLIFMKKRKQKLELDRAVPEFSVNVGVIQASVFLPLLLTMVVDEVDEVTENARKGWMN